MRGHADDGCNVACAAGKRHDLRHQVAEHVRVPRLSSRSRGTSTTQVVEELGHGNSLSEELGEAALDERVRAFSAAG